MKPGESGGGFRNKKGTVFPGMENRKTRVPMAHKSELATTLLTVGPFLVVFVSLACLPYSALTQSEDVVRTARVVPGPKFAAGPTHRFFYGDLWRDVWAEPVDAEVLDLEHFDGGLTLLGGGGTRVQTGGSGPSETSVVHANKGTVPKYESVWCRETLLFRGANQKLYSFSLLNSGPRARLPGDVRALFAPEMHEELVAAAHPYGELVATPLFNAAGVLNQKVRLVIFPESERLGELKNAADGRPGILTTYPDRLGEEMDFAEAMASSRSTFEFLELLEQDYRNRVDAVEYLKVRIMDLFVGDWDRHEERWRWVVRHEESVDEWLPVSLCRPQIFARYDGVLSWIGSFVFPELGKFDEDYAGAKTWAWSARHLDRRLLSPLERHLWDSVTAVILSRLTDSVIAEAVSQLPATVYAREGAELIRTLKVRRGGLSAAVDEYYRWLSSTVDIRGSDRQEYAEITRSDDAHVEVSLFACNGAGSPQRDTSLYHRVFSSEETVEIRLYMLGGDDRVILRGTVESSIPVIVVGGDGEDQVVDSSHVGGYLFSVVPFVHDAESATYVYDSEGKGVQKGSGTEVDVEDDPVPLNDVMRFTPSLEDRGTAWKAGVMFDWNSQLGIIAGFGPILYHYGFRQDPYACRLSLVGGYAPITNVGRIVFNADFRSLLQNASVSLEALASGYELLTYYGPGNETVPVRDPNDEYYRVHQQLFKAEPALQYPAHGPISATVKTGIRYVRTDPDMSSFVRDVGAYGVENMVLATLGAGLRWDSRDLDLHPYSGVFVDIEGTFFPKAFTAGEAFGKARGDMRVFYSPGETSPVTMTVRLVGEKTWGKVPYFEAASIGSSTLLRGYQQKRFSGNASLAGVFETRVRVGELNFIFPTSVGVFGFVETGRVFVPGEVSRRWHPSSGAGVWAAPWNRETTVTTSLGFSEESVLLYGSIGFSF